MGNGAVFELKHWLQPNPPIFVLGAIPLANQLFGMSLIGAVRTFPITTAADAVEHVVNGNGHQLAVLEQQCFTFGDRLRPINVIHLAKITR